MSFIRVGDLVINLDAIKTVNLSSQSLAGFSVDIEFLDGKKKTFDDEEADKLRAFFSHSKLVEDVMAESVA